MKRITLPTIRSHEAVLVFPSLALVTNTAMDTVGCRLWAITAAEELDGEELAAAKVDAQTEVTTQFQLLIAAIAAADQVEGDNEARRHRELEVATTDLDLTQLKEKHDAERLAASKELNGARAALVDLTLVEQHLLGVIDDPSTNDVDQESSTGEEVKTTAL